MHGLSEECDACVQRSTTAVPSGGVRDWRHGVPVHLVLQQRMLLCETQARVLESFTSHRLLRYQHLTKEETTWQNCGSWWVFQLEDYFSDFILKLSVPINFLSFSRFLEFSRWVLLLLHGKLLSTLKAEFSSTKPEHSCSFWCRPCDDVLSWPTLVKIQGHRPCIFLVLITLREFSDFHFGPTSKV